ncbi:hypothetical protein ZHAS_00016837 [Anopheles sinensis]|uniref:Uncharacterized protein n=1 Tax=Anopheles sinensis TaxID=74873 RepID=A0A084WE84_ANOSI|nr:hypothetical protein ZHAS_00016837 [Anopheles sinensis]
MLRRPQMMMMMAAADSVRKHRPGLGTNAGKGSEKSDVLSTTSATASNLNPKRRLRASRGSSNGCDSRVRLEDRPSEIGLLVGWRRKWEKEPSDEKATCASLGAICLAPDGPSRLGQSENVSVGGGANDLQASLLYLGGVALIYLPLWPVSLDLSRVLSCATALQNKII